MMIDERMQSANKVQNEQWTYDEGNVKALWTHEKMGK